MNHNLQVSDILNGLNQGGIYRGVKGLQLPKFQKNVLNRVQI